MPVSRREACARSIAAVAIATAAIGLAAGCAKTDYSDTNEATAAATAPAGAGGAAHAGKPGFVPQMRPGVMRKPVILSGAPH